MPEQAVSQFLDAHLHPGVRRLVVACSGGLDSMALLDVVAAKAHLNRYSLHVVHVHHGLSRFADDWAELVQLASARHQASFCKLSVRVGDAGSLEEAAREARYRAIAGELKEGDVLLTAHHRNDQAETVLLRLLRGSGVRGLSGMHPVSDLPFSEGRFPLWRPLLTVGRSQLELYARSRGLVWVDDASNQDIRHDRNALRHGIIPELETRWPQAVPVLALTAQRMQEADSLLNDLAILDLQPLLRENFTLCISGLQTLSRTRQINLLRFWLLSQGLTAPDRPGLHRIMDEVCAARCDGTPEFNWRLAEVRRYRDQLYAMKPLPEADNSFRVVWQDRESPLVLPSGRTLSPVCGGGTGIRLSLWRQAGVVEVRFRQGGERLRIDGSGHHKALKNLFQEAGTPSWQRPLWPLIYVDGVLAMVPGIGFNADFAANGEPALLIT
ncbi:MAG: tRNA lysidine(34) synthetase TilS [Fluviicoccus sp.]|uniref:tRNA lysidine(34) synthetase TilS n=1 Tax=Fluviicoccus sp. TaxID=2003552 RepID=UPI0027210CFF|nr:tRNA lysidine(34) synthetase TilS [Fluviicoccus sp.]MDO8331785.1 tRNA lysidine(34) synthetase TilS [Fluviicoccus sp.]